MSGFFIVSFQKNKTHEEKCFVYALSETNFSLFTPGPVSRTQTFSHRHMMSIENGKKVENQAKDISANRWLLGFFKANLQ